MYSKKVLIQSEPFCGTGIIQLHAYFVEHIIYGYFLFTWFFIGITLNTVNIVIFTRKTLRSSNNLILANLAIADTFAVIAFMPRAWHEFIRVRTNSVKEHRVYEWETISRNSWQITRIFHGVSIWLTMMLAVWRYIAVAHPLKERDWCDMRTTRNWIIAGYVVYCLILMPVYFDTHVDTLVTLLDNEGNITSNTTVGIPTPIAKIQHTKMNKLFRSLRLVVHGVLLKIVPCVVVAVFTCKLIVALIRAKKRREMLTASINQSQTSIVKIKQSTDRTTKMILVVLFLFLISEIPHGTCHILQAVYGSKFFLGCYSFLAEMFNSLVVICTSINFIVYYFMSKQFRNTFRDVFHCKIFSSRKPHVIYPESYKSYDTSARSSVTSLQSTPTTSITTISSSHNIM